MGKRSILALLIVLAASPAASTPSHNDTGLVRVEVFRVGLIAGAATGHGVLSFQGRHYRFRMLGLSLGTAGVAASRLSGHVANLHQPEDFEGTYSAVGLGGTWVLGEGFVQLTNDKGVTIALQGGRAGIELAANVSGIIVRFECRHGCAQNQ
jgi:hypothetical protein